MKQCPKCSEQKPLEEFHVSSDRKDGRASWCKECFKSIANQAGKRKREAGLCRCGKERRDGKKDCADCAAYAAAYKARRRTDPEYVRQENEKSRQRYQKLKQQLHEHYGDSCRCCGETAVEFLTIDHMWSLDRYPTDAPRAGAKLYAWLRRTGFPDGFRTLCMNCNWALGHYGYCPHGNL